MTNKQEVFVNEYMSNGFKGREAALAAQYSPNGLDRTVYKLLHKTKDVTDEIDKRMKELKEKSEWDLLKMKNELTYLYDETKYLRSKKEALECLKEISKLLGLYATQSIEIKGIDNINININK